MKKTAVILITVLFTTAVLCGCVVERENDVLLPAVPADDAVSGTERPERSPVEEPADESTPEEEPTETESVVFTQEDIDSAMAVVTEYFDENFEHCTLRELYYDEEETVREIGIGQYDEDKVIVLVSTYEVDETGGDGNLEPGSIYEGWKWILTRSDGDAWTLRTWGYG